MSTTSPSFTCTRRDLCARSMMICSLGTSAGRTRSLYATTACLRRDITITNLKIWSWNARSYEASSTSSFLRLNPHWTKWKWRSRWFSQASTSMPSLTHWFKIFCSCTPASKKNTGRILKRATQPSKVQVRPKVRIDLTELVLHPQIWLQRITSSRNIKSIVISKKQSLSKSYKR